MLIVVTDRISAFDVVMNEPIPDKGRVDDRPPELQNQAEQLEGRFIRSRSSWLLPMWP